MKSIDRQARLSLYHQLYEILHQKILLGELKPGDQLPTENELIRRYQVSRITVRRVLNMLVQEGLIYRQAGRGSFVAHATLEHGLSHIVSFTEDMRRRGFEVSTRVLFSGLVAAESELAKKLDVPVGEELARLERLRLADGEPMCIENSHFVHRYCPGLLHHDFSVESLREIKIQKYGIRWIRAQQTIRAINAPRELAEPLRIKKGTALLFVERVSFSQDNIPVEFLQAYYRADRYAFYNKLLGETG
ncbi:MAG TPA: GntR family transcriptional regulator [Sedimentisphaerales bacterium]|nr:GntR family transcriptional regulator [Sedimentisphaerales bacterium]